MNLCPYHLLRNPGATLATSLFIPICLKHLILDASLSALFSPALLLRSERSPLPPGSLEMPPVPRPAPLLWVSSLLPHWGQWSILSDILATSPPPQTCSQIASCCSWDKKSVSWSQAERGWKSTSPASSPAQPLSSVPLLSVLQAPVLPSRPDAAKPPPHREFPQGMPWPLLSPPTTGSCHPLPASCLGSGSLLRCTPMGWPPSLHSLLPTPTTAALFPSRALSGVDHDSCLPRKVVCSRRIESGTTLSITESPAQSRLSLGKSSLLSL